MRYHLFSSLVTHSDVTLCLSRWACALLIYTISISIQYSCREHVAGGVNIYLYMCRSFYHYFCCVYVCMCMWYQIRALTKTHVKVLRLNKCSSIITSLLNCAPTGLTHHWYAPACLHALSIINTRLAFINRHLTHLCLDLCCFVTVETYDMLCARALINHSPPVSLLFFILPCKAVFYAF